jgi:triacylglycerol esterase/lipase EstA (alpha/beta hydrolase family)
MRGRFRLTVAAAAVCACVVAGAASGATYTPTPSLSAGLAAAALDPTGSPPGANVACTPTSAHPYPVVLIHGTFGDMIGSWGAVSAFLANAGYCVYALNYGGASPTNPIQATGPVPTSAQQVAAFVQQVRAATGAAKVDLVGHSQGGMIAEYYAKLLGGAAFVHRIVALSPTTHGTTLDGIGILASFIPGASALVGSFCQACVDQTVGSPVIAALDSGPIAQPGVGYTVIETLNETVVTPVGSSFIRETGVKNEYVQSFCPLDTVDHVNLPYDRVVIRLVMNALDPGTAQQPNCFVEFPFPA